MFSPLSVCLLLAKSKIFQVYWSVDVVLPSICLLANRLLDNSKPIVMTIYQVVEVASTEKPIDVEVKGHLEIRFLKVIFHPIDLKVE